MNDTEFEIKSGVPLPSVETSRRRRWPFHIMSVGDHFDLPCRSSQSKDAIRLRAAASYYGRKHNKRFTTRAIEGGVRCWREE